MNGSEGNDQKETWSMKTKDKEKYSFFYIIQKEYSKKMNLMQWNIMISTWEISSKMVNMR